MSVELAERTPEALREWLTNRVAYYLDAAPDDIDPETPLAEYGLGSVYIVSVFGDFEDRYGLSLEPTLAWDHPTIEALAEHLSTMLA
ncbi:acyl carrier protein [Rhizohabitans arisaemae]|uniref:acyl carrier protein n=1 Tax=Rhizohabitans arisaemae TaxID=2720610 RepID=UPI0024B15E8E|nr:acyl carrier protein [Rhizohabitans arisaemae]